MHGHFVASESLDSSNTDEPMNQHHDQELQRKVNADHQALPDQEFP